MPITLLFTVASAGCFLTLARAAITTTHDVFRRVTALMAVVAAGLALLAPLPGLALLAPVLFVRLLSAPPIPATVPLLVDRYQRPRR